MIEGLSYSPSALSSSCLHDRFTFMIAVQRILLLAMAVSSLFGCTIKLSPAPLKIGDNPVAVAYVDQGACPFECCVYREWRAKEGIEVKERMSEKSAAVFSIKKGEWVDGVTGVVVTTRVGQGRVTRPTIIGGRRVRPGTLIEVLNYAGEGVYKLRLQGMIIEPGAYDDSSVDILTEPSTVWWVYVRNSRGQSGWTTKARSFENQDACG